MRAAVGGFHESRAAAGDHGESGVRQQARDRLGLRRSTDGPGLMRALPNMRHGGTHAAQAFGRGGELCHNPQHPPGLLPVGRVHRLRIDQLRNLAGLTAMPTLVLVDGSSYLYRAFHALPDLRTSTRRADRRAARCAVDVAPDGRGRASRTTSPSSSTRRARPSATTGIPSTRRTARRCPTTSCARSSRCTSWCARNGWPLLMIDGVEADDVIGTLARQARRRASTRVDLDRRQGSRAARASRASRCVNTMSNETLDERRRGRASSACAPDQVLDLLDADRRHRRQRARRGQGRAEDGGEVARAIRDARRRRRACGRDPRRGRREPARGARLAAAGRRLLTVKTDCELAGRAGRSRARRAATRRSCKALYERFEFKSWLRDVDRQRRSRTRPARSPTRAARDTRGRRCGPRPRSVRRTRRRRVAARTTRRWSTTRRSSAGSRRSRRAELVCFDTETTSLDPMQAQHRRAVVRDRARARVLHPARRIATRARPSSSPRRRARATRAVARRSGEEEARPERQVRPARARQPRHGARRRRARHAARILRARVAPAARHGQPRVAPSRREDDHLRRRRRQGREADSASTRSRIERATAYSAEDADITLQLHRRLYPRDRRRCRSSTTSTRRSRCRCARSCSGWSANGVLIDARAARAAEPRAGRHA